MNPLSDTSTFLFQLTMQRFEANATNDHSYYERLLAPNFLTMLPHRLPMNKKEYLGHEFALRSGPSHGPGALIADFRAVVESETALVSYQVAEPTPIGDHVFEVCTRRLDTYARIEGEWRLLSMAMADVPSWPDVAVIGPTLYEEYAGIYHLAEEIRVVVTHEQGRLWAAMTGQSKSELFPENETTFFDKTDSPFARTVFERDKAGKVVSQLYRNYGQQLRARKLS